MVIQTDLEQSVLQTVLWFSMFSFPLTAFEIWKWLLLPQRPYQLGEVYAILEKSDWLRGKLDFERGFFGLKGELIQDQIQDRQDRFLDAERKFRVLRKASTYFQLLPAVRAVAVVNTTAWWSTKPESDIDLYIVTRPGFIWSSRFFLVLPFLLLGRRPHATVSSSTHPDPFCFSFFSSSSHLQLEDVCFPRDYYMAFWVKALVPVFDRDQSFETFHHENRWATRMLPNALPRRQHRAHQPRHLLSLPVQWKVLEPLFRALQLSRFPSGLRDLANRDSRVVVNESMLKFHESDRRELFRDDFEKLLERHL